MRGNDDVICNRLGRDEGDIFSFLKCGIGDPVFIAREKVSYTRPVVLVPGFGGSALNARVLNHKAYPWYCKIFSLFSSSSSSKTSSSTSSSSKTFHLWFSIPELLAQRCVFADMALAFNETAQTFTPSATKDIVVTPNDFGGVQGIDFLERIGPVPVAFTAYMSPLIASLVAAGYKVGDTLFGAPYDFRLGPKACSFVRNQDGGDDAGGMGEGGECFLKKLKALIETAVAKNGGAKAVLVAHSLGCLEALELLRAASPEWRARYVDTFVPIAGPFAGSPKALKGALIGSDFGLNVQGTSILSLAQTQRAAKTFPGVAWLMPFAEEMWEETAVVTIGGAGEGEGGSGEVYTPHTLPELLERVVGLNETATVLRKVRVEQEEGRVRRKMDVRKAQGDDYDVDEEVGLVKPKKNGTISVPPGVRVVCIYGVGIPTEMTYHFPSYDAITPGRLPLSITYGNGDGTVPIQSLRICEEWKREDEEVEEEVGGGEGEEVEVHVYPAVSHQDIVSLPQVMMKVVTEATRPKEEEASIKKHSVTRDI